MFKKHPILSVICILLSVLILAMVVTGAMILNHGNTVPAVLPQYLLVLGTTVEGTDPSPMLQDRINAAYDYLTENPEVICIVSGYQSGNGLISEAECMFGELITMGIDPSRIWMEPNATSTVENFEFSLDLIEEETGTRPDWLGVLSSEFHLMRASMIAADQNIRVITVGAKTTDLPTFLFYFLREIVVVWSYVLF